MVVKKNYGISLGIALDWWLLIVIGLVVITVKDRDLGWRLMIIGGIANLIDRLVFGYVRDYWSLSAIGIYNNINDWLIFVGILWKIMEWKSHTKMRV